MNLLGQAMTDKLSHFDDDGKAVMVDVADKEVTHRTAVARAEITMQPETLAKVLDGRIGKGDVFGVARLAGILAAKKTPEIIPLCHPLLLSSVQLEFTPNQPACSVVIEATVKLKGQTGVEMEALTAVSAAALTIYDMCKAIDKSMVIGKICLLEKSGGRSGHYRRSGAADE